MNLFVIREVGGDLKFTSLERMFEDNLVAAMADVDRCLTTAYDRKLAGDNPAPILEKCRMAELHQFVLDCGATFTDELYKLTKLSFTPFSGARAERKRIAEANIKANCAPLAPLPPATATPAAPPAAAAPASAPAATGSAPAAPVPPTAAPAPKP